MLNLFFGFLILCACGLLALLAVRAAIWLVGSIKVELARNAPEMIAQRAREPF